MPPRPAADGTSISENGPSKLLDLNVPLDSHQRTWADWLARQYIARFKDIKQIINLTLKPTFHVSVADVVYLKIPERMHLNGTLCQVLDIRPFGRTPTTVVKLVTL